MMETEFSSQDQDQGMVESDSESKDREDEKMQCDLNSQEKEDEAMHCKEAVIEGAAPLQKDPVTSSRSAIEEEVTRTLLRKNSWNDAMGEETLGKNTTRAIPKASTSSRTELKTIDFSSIQSDTKSVFFLGVLRTWAFSDGPGTRSLQISPGVFNDKALENEDSGTESREQDEEADEKSVSGDEEEFDEVVKMATTTKMATATKMGKEMKYAKNGGHVLVKKYEVGEGSKRKKKDGD